MRILLVTQYFLPEPLANAEVIGALAVALGRAGHDVDVITPVAPTQVGRGVMVRSTWGYFPKDRASRSRRLLEYLTFSVGALLRSVTLPRPDVVLVPSPPPSLGLVGLVIGRLRRAPLIYNVQDLYPEVAESTGGVPTFLLRLVRRAMREVYQRSAAVVVIDPYFVPVIEAAAPGARVVSVPNGIDVAPFVDVAPDTTYLGELGVSVGAPVVMYAGNVGRSQELWSVVEATGAVGATLVIHGGGARLEELRDLVQARGQDHVRFSPFRERSELGRVFASALVHVVPLKPGIAHASVPSKLLSIFSAGRPAIVVAEPTSPAARVVKESGGGWLVDPGDQEGLLAVLHGSLEDVDDRERRAVAATNWAATHASAAEMARAYEPLLASLGRATSSPRSSASTRDSRP
jgi:colanic acid biosynthesis glycosyl transferase WcaI